MSFEEHNLGAVRRGVITRRELLQRLALLGVSTTYTIALMASCSEGNGDQAGKVKPSSAGSRDGNVTFDGPRGELQAVLAEAADSTGSLLVIHDEGGLTPYFVALPGRLAKSGYTTLAVDLPTGPRRETVADLQAGLDYLADRTPKLKLGALGFGFGAEMAWSLLDAPEPRLAAVALFDGPLPGDTDLAGAQAAVMAIYSGHSPLNARRVDVESVLLRAGLKHEFKVFLDTEEGFFDDTGPHYNQRSAEAAYQAVLDWFGLYLA